MKRAVLFYLLLIFALFHFACEKRKATPGGLATVSEAPATTSYSQLKTGNYWIYAYYKVERTGLATLAPGMDSCYVEKDTLIHSATFFKLCRHLISQNINLTSYLRDSLDYIIDQTGKILFSSQDFSTVFYTYYVLATPSPDTLYRVTDKMTDKDQILQLSSGTFTTSNMQSTFYTAIRFTTPRAPNINYTNARYGKNVGLITQTEPLVYEANDVTERRLIRYHVR